MTSQNGPVPPAPARSTSPGGPRTPKLIPLQPGIARPTGERRALMRDAVIQVVQHLVLRTVPPGERSQLFDQAGGPAGPGGLGT